MKALKAILRRFAIALLGIVDTVSIKKRILGGGLSTLMLFASGSIATPISIISSASHNGNNYYLLSQANWTDSEAFAVTLGGHLTTINDETENNFVYDAFTNTGDLSRGLWIGLNDVVLEGSFVWANGEPLDYTNWGPAFGGPPEPNNFGGIEDYVHILWTGDPRAPKWNDAPDSAAPFGVSMHGVVELVATPLEEPDTRVLIASIVSCVGWVCRKRPRIVRDNVPFADKKSGPDQHYLLS